MSTEPKTPAFKGYEREPTAPAEPVVFLPTDDAALSAQQWPKTVAKLFADIVAAYGEIEGKAMLRAAANKIDPYVGSLSQIHHWDRAAFVAFLTVELANREITGALTPDAEAAKRRIEIQLAEINDRATGKKK